MQVYRETDAVKRLSAPQKIVAVISKEMHIQDPMAPFFYETVSKKLKRAKQKAGCDGTYDETVIGELRGRTDVRPLPHPPSHRKGKGTDQSSSEPNLPSVASSAQIATCPQS